MSVEVDCHDVASRFADLLARVRSGEEITIADAGRPIAKLVPVAGPRRPEFGALKGMMEIGDDFNDPLPEEELREWEK